MVNSGLVDLQTFCQGNTNKMHFTSYGVSLDATSYIYASEIFPTPARAKGLSISLSGLFTACIIFLSAAPTAFAAVGWKYYLIFVISSSIMTVVVYLYYPETTKKTLEEVGAVFGDSVEGLSKDVEVKLEVVTT